MARRSRAKSGTFYLTKQVDTASQAFNQAELDISSFVNVLQGEVVRVKQAWFNFASDNGQPIQGADLGASAGCSATAAITVESHDQRASFGHNSVMAGTAIYAHTDSNTDIDMITIQSSMNPADFEDGFLVATDAIYIQLAPGTDAFANDIRCTMKLECEIVRLSLSDAQAVLVSQTLG
jgi:hypothetical protein